MAAAAIRAKDHAARGVKYAQAIVAGEIPACMYVKLACERHLRDLETYKEQGIFYFDAKAANRVCNAIEHFRHIHGDWARGGQRLTLEDWQRFIVCNVFGWMVTESKTRRFRVAYIEIPRKNAKSTLTSAVGLYLLACDGEAGAVVVSAANTQSQAKLVFGDAQAMAKKDDEFQAKYGVQVKAHAIVQPQTDSKFEALSAEYSNLDGLNLHAALIDELHAHANRGLWDVLETAMASRIQPLLWAITTAGDNKAGVCYNQRDHVVDVLKGHIVDDGYFGIIYTADQDDDLWDENTWIKCNPNWGVSIFPANIRREAATAQTMPSAHNAFLSKHLNVWVNADSAWMPHGAWEKCTMERLDIEDFIGQRCYLGVDLATRVDLNVVMVLFPPDGERNWYAAFGYYFLPEGTIAQPGHQHYQGWETAGFLISTAGTTTDFNRITETIEDLYSRFEIAEIAYDPHLSAAIVTALADHGVVQTPQVEVKQIPVNMSPAMVELEGLIMSRRIRHNGDPVLAWMMSNVRAKHVGNLIQPVKDIVEKKIDGVTALITALNRALKAPPPVDWSTRPGLYSV